jgi:hypothetical protein
MLLRALVMLAIMGGLSANAAALQTSDSADGLAATDAATLLQFYPTPLATSPVGATEDKAVWLAKVQGLIAAAPPLLRQSMLASATRQDFAANLTLLQQLQRGTLDEGIVAAKSLAKSGKLAAKGVDGKVGPNLGSGPADTVFTYLEPCRIMDTRNATVASGVHGPLVGNQLYHIVGFIAAGSNWGVLGGNATSDCGLNSTVGFNIWAVAIVITILNPNFDAFLGVGDNSTLAATLSTVALNYTHGQGLSTQYIVPQGLTNNIYFAMPAQLSANIIFDVVGYFAVSQATALDCVDVMSSTVSIAAHGAAAALSPECAAGYQMTSGSCFAGNSGVNLGVSLLSSMQYCAYDNPSAFGSVIQAEGRCCRVPGR